MATILIRKQLKEAKVSFNDRNFKAVAQDLMGIASAQSAEKTHQAAVVMARMVQILKIYPALAVTQNLNKPDYGLGHDVMDGRNDEVAGCCFQSCMGCSYMKAIHVPEKLPGMQSSKLASHEVKFF